VKVQSDIGPAVAHDQGVAPAVTLVVMNEYSPGGNLRSVERRSEPNLANTGNHRTEWTYDRAGRKLSQTELSGRQQIWTYDAAGNVKEWTTGRVSGGSNVVITTTYDTLNRPRRRTSPSVTRAPALGTMRSAFQCLDHAPRFPQFPSYDPNVEPNCDLGTTPLPPALVIPTDIAEFTYDKLGNVLTAYNNDARITREYFPNGALKTERQAIAVLDEETPLEARFNAHVYRLNYAYDLSGRRITRTDSIPTCVECVQTYRYTDGFLDLITDSGAGHPTAQFAFQYDSIGRLALWTVNGTRSSTEHHFDADSRMTGREVIGNGVLIYQDVLAYDKASRVKSSVTTSGFISYLNGATAAAYNGLGALAYFRHDRNGTVLEDEYVTDGVGSRVSDKRWLDGQFTAHDYTYTRDRLDEVRQATPWQGAPPPSKLQLVDTALTDYSATGSVEYSFRSPFRYNSNDGLWAPQLPGAEWIWHAYDANERLRVTQRSTQTETGRPRTAFSEYWYDALGRRILVRTRWANCQSPQPDCLPTIERTIWDGDQVLAELRSLATSELDYDLGSFYGTVRYTHGGGIDEPLALWKLDVGGIVPHRSWRGTYEAGTPIDGTSSNVNWPARTQDVFFSSDARVDAIQQDAWIGNLVEGKTDPSGLQYMRNRYYDPKSGRFTQEDPIGLAGGVNLYGFANGDPISFQDPFGLTVCDRDHPGDCSLKDYVGNFLAGLRTTSSGDLQDKGPGWSTGAALAQIGLMFGVRAPVGTGGEALGTAAVATPHGIALQEGTTGAVTLGSEVANGAQIYRGGMFGRSAAAEGQFWAAENPLNPGFAARFGAASLNSHAPDFVIAGTIRQAMGFITRTAPAFGGNPGGSLEIVTRPGAVWINFFHMP
jgi:RHS repeat-associated protein